MGYPVQPYVIIDWGLYLHDVHMGGLSGARSEPKMKRLVWTNVALGLVFDFTPT